MTTYVLLLLYALMLGLFKELARKTKASDTFAFICFFSVMMFLALLRGETVGADTDNYIRYFQDIRFLSFGDLLEYSRDSYNPLEYGYKVYNWLLVRISSNPQMITAMNSLLFLLGLFVLIWKESEDKWLSLFLFLTLGFYQTALNMTPSFIAAFIAFNGIKYIRQKKLIHYVVCLVLAMQMHTAAILFLPLYWADKIAVARKRLVMVGCVAAILTLGYGLYASWLGAHVPGKYQYYFTMAGTKYEQLLVAAVQIALFIIVSRYSGGSWLMRREYRIDVWIVIVSIVAYMVSTNMMIFSRISFMFAPYMVITLPKIIANIKDGKKRKWAEYLVVAFCAMQYICRMMVNNIGSTMPYYFASLL